MRTIKTYSNGAPFYNALIVQVPRRFASITSRTRLQDNFRVAHNSSRTSSWLPGLGPTAGCVF